MIHHLAIYLKCSIEALGASGARPVVAQGPSGEAPQWAADPITDSRNSEGALQ